MLMEDLIQQLRVSVIDLSRATGIVEKEMNVKIINHYLEELEKYGR